MADVRRIETPSRRAVPAVLIGSGSVVAAAVAHVSGGATLPPWPLLFALASGLSLAAHHCPRRLRTIRMRLAAAALLQPVLHGAFEAVPHGSAGATGTGTVLLLAHAVAALAAAWWTVRGVELALAAPRRALAAAQPPGALLLPAPARTFTSGTTVPRPTSHWVRATPRRGPPTVSFPS